MGLWFSFFLSLLGLSAVMTTADNGFTVVDVCIHHQTVRNRKGKPITGSKKKTIGEFKGGGVSALTIRLKSPRWAHSATCHRAHARSDHARRFRRVHRTARNHGGPWPGHARCNAAIAADGIGDKREMMPLAMRRCVRNSKDIIDPVEADRAPVSEPLVVAADRYQPLAEWSSAGPAQRQTIGRSARRIGFRLSA